MREVNDFNSHKARYRKNYLFFRAYIYESENWPPDGNFLDNKDTGITPFPLTKKDYDKKYCMHVDSRRRRPITLPI